VNRTSARRVGLFLLAVMLFLLAAASVFVVLSGDDGIARLMAVPLAATYAYVGLSALGAARRT
jgi:hypothetical protein